MGDVVIGLGHKFPSHWVRHLAIERLRVQIPSPSGCNASKRLEDKWWLQHIYGRPLSTLSPSHAHTATWIFKCVSVYTLICRNTQYVIIYVTMYVLQYTEHSCLMYSMLDYMRRLHGQCYHCFGGFTCSHLFTMLQMKNEATQDTCGKQV